MPILRFLGFQRKQCVTLNPSYERAPDMQLRYNKHLVQLKFDELYISRYLERCEYWDNMINGFVAFASAGSVSAWALWKKYDMLWASIVASAQVLTVLKPYLPFKKRIAPLRAVGYVYEEIFLEAEEKWLSISNGDLSEEEINKLLFSQKDKQAKAFKRLAGDISLPVSSRLRRKADEATALYFNHNYNVQAIIQP